MVIRMNEVGEGGFGRVWAPALKGLCIVIRMNEVGEGVIWSGVGPGPEGGCVL